MHLLPSLPFLASLILSALPLLPTNHFVNAQSLSDLPSCAQQAGLSGITASGCAVQDITCICSQTPFIATLRQYICKSCSVADQNASLQFAQRLCATVGISIPAQMNSCGLPSSDSSAPAAAAPAVAKSVDAPAPAPATTSAAAAAPAAMSSGGAMDAGGSASDTMSMVTATSSGDMAMGKTDSMGMGTEMASKTEGGAPAQFTGGAAAMGRKIVGGVGVWVAGLMTLVLGWVVEGVVG
ncbi:MAG: hypothetical protein Q9160_005507 [Pyrenula sp. 1 TL-2023]